MRFVLVAAAASALAALPAAAGEPLPAGEYSCIGSGGQILIGLGFKLADDGTYTDLDDASRGTYAIAGDRITFSGGHLDGETGRDIANHGFVLGDMASCQIWG